MKEVAQRAVGTGAVDAEHLACPVGNPCLGARDGVEILRGCGAEERWCRDAARELGREPVATTPDPPPPGVLLDVKVEERVVDASAETQPCEKPFDPGPDIAVGCDQLACVRL